jgi:DinB superfamily
VPHEHCAECGFDSDDWTDRAALEAIGGLPDRWAAAVAGVSPDDLGRRPIAHMWSIAEYVDHVREVLFAMRFVAVSALETPGLDLGPSPESAFAAEARPVDVQRALSGIRGEATGLVSVLDALTDEQWVVTAQVGSTTIDLRWVARHAVHDATHHLYDVESLRAGLA